MFSHCSQDAADGGASFSSLQQQSAEQIIDIPVPRTRGDRVFFKVFTQDKFRRSVLWSRSSTFLLVVVFKIFSLILGCQPHPQSHVMSVSMVLFFRTFPRVQKKCAVCPEDQCEMDAGVL